jgi:hypothetical protein
MNGMQTPTIHAMLRGMLVIVVPAFLIVVGVTLMAYRRRNSSSED